MITNININFDIKSIQDFNEVIASLSSLKSNTSIQNSNICIKCWNEKRFVNLWVKSFYTCDTCNPRKNSFIKHQSHNLINSDNNTDIIICPDCWSVVKKSQSKFWAYYKCNCGFKIDPRNKDFNILIKEYEW